MRIRADLRRGPRGRARSASSSSGRSVRAACSSQRHGCGQDRHNDLPRRSLLLGPTSALVLLQSFPAMARGVQADISDGMAQFRQGNVQASIVLFDRAMQTRPSVKPYLWQRGLSLYYAQRYEDAAEQFRADVAVNPNDTEEAIWAYLAEAQLLGPAAARAQLLQVGVDPRPYMRQAYAAVQAATPAEVLEATRVEGASIPDTFYLLLYRGLLLEALGDAPAAAAAVRAATDTEYAQKYLRKDYMIALAAVHCQLRDANVAV